MKSNDSLPFLDALEIDYSAQLRNTWWLASDFDAPIWTINAGYSYPQKLDWRVMLDDRTLLTAPKNTPLFTSFRYWLTSSTEGRYKKIGDGMVSEKTDRQRILNTTYAMDYLLLNAEYFELSKYGLAGLNDSHLKTILDQFASNGAVAESIYEFKRRATEYLINLKNSEDKSTLFIIIDKYPAIAETSSDILEDENRLPLAKEDIPLVRAALYRHNFYKGHDSGGYHVKNKMLTSAIYPNILKRSFGKLPTHILSFYPSDPPYNRELIAVPVSSRDNEGITKATYMSFRRSLISLTTLHAIGVNAPLLTDIQEIEDYKPPIVPYQRFRSVPSSIIFRAFKEAVELHFKHGRKIIDGFLKVVRHCVIHHQDMKGLTDKELQKIIGPDLVALGVKKLGLACENFSHTHFRHRQRRKPNKSLYFKHLRANHGLLELLSVYIGSVQFVVGALMARRHSELMELPTSCLDETLNWLIVELAKMSKGVFGARETQARPIDKLGTRMIRELQRMQRYLKKIGHLKNYESIFATPSLAGVIELKPSITHLYNRNLDLFFDYIENATDVSGRRYYIRQHQLRRFFALLFFHYFDEGSINAARWFLGHADLEHIWNYITATIDGAALRGAKSQHVVQEIIGGRAKNYQNLADLLTDQFGTSNFSIQDEEAVDNYVQDLMERGEVTIEPEFFESHDGKHMKIVVKIHHT